LQREKRAIAPDLPVPPGLSLPFSFLLHTETKTLELQTPDQAADIRLQTLDHFKISVSVEYQSQ